MKKSYLKIVIAGSVFFGLLLAVSFAAFLGASPSSLLGRFITIIYSVLIFPLHFWGGLLSRIAGKGVLDIPYGIFFVLLTLPITYGLFGWLIYFLIKKWRKKK